MQLRNLESNLSQLGRGELIAFAVFLGISATLFSQYRYGFVNHIEQLPPIMRALDPTVMAGDETVDELCTFGPRHYYVGLITGLARLMPLPVVYLLLTVLAHTATAGVTLVAARRWFAGSNAAALIAAVLTLGVSSIGIGGAAHLFRAQLVPQTLATPLLLAALTCALLRRPLASVMLAAPGCLLHPLAGAHTALLGLATLAVAELLWPTGSQPPSRRQRLAGFRHILLAGLLFGGFVYGAWMARGAEHRYDLAFMLDFARFRSPHHHLPSQFSFGTYAAFVCFLGATALAWKDWYDDPATDHGLARRVALCVGLILALLLAGYVFVEVFPTKVFLMAQTFRLVFIIKWLGLMLFGAWVARMLGRRRSARDWAASGVLLLGSGPYQPGFALTAQLWHRLTRRGDTRGATRETAPPPNAAGTTARNLAAGAFLCAAVVALTRLWQPECLGELLALGIGLTVVMLLAYLRRAWLRIATTLIVPGILIGLVIFGAHHDGTASAPLGSFQPVLTLAGGTDSRDAVARFVRDHTPDDAVILTPPYFGRFRILAERGLVVDYKCMPYDARGYARWHERLRDCYGEIKGVSSQALIVMKNHYIWIKPERIQRVGEKYGADYAVLYKDTPNDWPVLYRDRRFKLVAIPPAAPTSTSAPATAAVSRTTGSSPAG
jgi:hypothetical protein